MRLEKVVLAPVDGVPGFTIGPLSPGTSPEKVRVDVAVLRPGTSIPRHPAAREQVFYVVDGHGRVAGDDDLPVEVTAGWAVTWSPGENHTSWAETEMTVLIVQRAAAEV